MTILDIFPGKLCRITVRLDAARTLMVAAD